MKHLFIVNPTAGGSDKTAIVTERVNTAFSHFETSGDTYEIYVTKAPMDAPGKIKAEAAENERLHVYACGGDGTFNECVCGAAGLDNVAVCPFPTGTGNDFCRMFGEEKDMFRDLGALLCGSEHPIDLIDCNGRFCSNICSVGIDARIGTSVHNYSKIPVIGGATGYVVSLIVNVFKGINRHMRVRIKDFYVDEELALVCVCNGRYYGGGFNPSLTARMTVCSMSLLSRRSGSSRSRVCSASTLQAARTNARSISRASRRMSSASALTRTTSLTSTVRLCSLRTSASA